MVAPALLSSNTAEWSTPQVLFDTLNATFHFTLDPHYADVIIERWEKFTGQEAVKIKEANA